MCGSGTREKRSHGSRPIRRPVENRSVPLPSRWENFLAHPENNADLASFLSQELIDHAPGTKIIIMAGGFSNEEMVAASSQAIETENLAAKHEEADSRVVLHCIHCKASMIVVAARDTDILVLLLAHFRKMPCGELWLKAGTVKKEEIYSCAFHCSPNEAWNRYLELCLHFMPSLVQTLPLTWQGMVRSLHGESS